MILYAESSAILDTGKEALRNFRVSRMSAVRPNTSKPVVEFSGDTGATMAAAALGRPDDAAPGLRRFDVRRTDSFFPLALRVRR